MFDKRKQAEEDLAACFDPLETPSKQAEAAIRLVRAVAPQLMIDATELAQAQDLLERVEGAVTDDMARMTNEIYELRWDIRNYLQSVPKYAERSSE